MKIKLNFSTHVGMGNVNDLNIEDNLESFKKAQLLCSYNKKAVEDSILEASEHQSDGLSRGATIRIPVQHLPNREMIDSLVFEVGDFDANSVEVHLLKVNYN